jgi:hypothetical protein
MTAASILTLDTDAAAAIDAGKLAASGERLCRLLDTHAISASWFVRGNAPAALAASIRAMRTRQDVQPRPPANGHLRPGAVFATRTHALAEIEDELQTFLTGRADRDRLAAGWMPNGVRLHSFRGTLERAIHSGQACHVHVRVAELGRKANNLRLIEDLLFRIAEERRSRRLRIVTVADARRAIAGERLTQAA